MVKANAAPPAGGWLAALDGAAQRIAALDLDAVLFQEEREDLRAEGDLRGVETTHSRTNGAAVRLSRPLRSAFLSGARPENLDVLVAAAKAGTPPVGSSGPFLADGGGAVLDGRRAARIVRTLISAALTERGGPEIVAVRAAYVAVSQTIRVARPQSPASSDLRKGERIRLDVTVRSRERSARATGEQVLRAGREVRLEEFARAVTIRAATRLAAVSPPARTCPAVFAPGVGGILVHEIVGHALEADVVLRGRSRLAAETETIATPAMRILDDPRRARVPWHIDDEGETARAVSLVEGGRVSGLMHDRASAAASGVQSTGHGRCASFRDPILPRMGCTFVAAGPAVPEEALEGVREGVFVRRMEAATVDPSTAYAVFRVTDADLIIDGRLTEPLAPFMFSIGTASALQSIEVLANDLEFDTCVGSCARDGQPLAISVGAPTCRLGVVKVIG